eukprot:1139885-Pelagomonas_calceolata.AAC.7
MSGSELVLGKERTAKSYKAAPGYEGSFKLIQLELKPSLYSGFMFTGGKGSQISMSKECSQKPCGLSAWTAVCPVRGTLVVFQTPGGSGSSPPAYHYLAHSDSPTERSDFVEIGSIYNTCAVAIISSMANKKLEQAVRTQPTSIKEKETRWLRRTASPLYYYNHQACYRKQKYS